MGWVAGVSGEDWTIGFVFGFCLCLNDLTGAACVGGRMMMFPNMMNGNSSSNFHGR